MSEDIKKKLHELLLEYGKHLPDKLTSIENEWQQLSHTWQKNKFKDFHRSIHSLCGSAGTYGYKQISQSARQLEVYLKHLLPNDNITQDQQREITRLLEHLKETFSQETSNTSTTTHLPMGSLETRTNTIYLLDDDPYYFNKIKNNIEEAGYQLQLLQCIDDLKNVMKDGNPMAIIIDLSCISSEDITFFNHLQHQKNNPIQLLCTADRDDILMRLKAIRMGNATYFQKSIEPYYLVKLIDQLCGTTSNAPYRILIIDDSHSLAEYYALILQEAGMIAYFITNPLLLIDTIDEFQPDLLLMDIYMPECTGLEMACVLRQEPRYTKLPIVFLSTEDDKQKQLSALNLGGDDFLTKPVVPKHLIDVVKSRAKRSMILNSYMMTDSLTGLLNHTHILQRLDIEMTRAERTHDVVSFVMVDIDYFKRINDNYGHPMGDSVIRKLSAFLLSTLRKSDTVGRYGGEEFALILPHTEADDARKICDELRKKFAKISFECNGNTFNVTISLGIACYPDFHEVSTLVKAADKALYAAKRQGRNQVTVFDEYATLFS